jgi:hypothetical protein
VPLGDALFPTQGDDPSSAAGAISAAAAQAHTIPPEQLVRIEVLGHTSRGWRHIPAGMTREQANQALSERRGQHVAQHLQPLVDPTGVVGAGAGDADAAAAGKSEGDLSPSDQRASMAAVKQEAGSGGGTTTTPGTPGSTSTTPGTPGTTTTTPGTPGTPDHQEPNQVHLGSLPNPFTSKRTAWGWDTTVSGSIIGGEAGAAGVYLGAGISYSIPLGKTHLSAETMRTIRTAVGFFKLIGDFMTISPLGFIRDLYGMGQPVAADAAPAIGGAATSFSMPAPS